MTHNLTNGRYLITADPDTVVLVCMLCPTPDSDIQEWNADTPLLVEDINTAAALHDQENHQ